MKAVRVHAYGGPEVLKYEDCPDPSPAPGQALVEIQAVGVNYTDIYSRSGLYPASPPVIPGVEAAGVVAAVGGGVTEVQAGDLVAYTGMMGAYAELAAVPAARLVKLPQGVDAKMGAAALLQGMTAHYLTRSTYALQKGDRALVHAGAGGVGLLLIQMAKRLGAYVFATVSSEAKAAPAKEAGADDVIVYTQEDFEQRVKKATDGQGVQVVYDSVGKSTFEGSLNSLARRGYLVLYGQASGPVPPIDTRSLMRGSVFLTRPALGDYTATREELLRRAGEVYKWILSGELRLHIHKTFSLSDAAEAHRALESRSTVGKLLLIP